MYHTSPPRTSYQTAKVEARLRGPLAWLFVNELGLYPVGTLCQLSSGELAVVTESQQDPERLECPYVKIIAEAGGEPMDGAVVNLADPAAGRSITRTLDARRHGIEVSRNFL